MVLDKIGRNGIFQEDDQREMLPSSGFVGSRHIWKSLLLSKQSVWRQPRERSTMLASRIWQSECCSRTPEKWVLVRDEIWTVCGAVVIALRIKTCRPRAVVKRVRQ